MELEFAKNSLSDNLSEDDKFNILNLSLCLLRNPIHENDGRELAIRILDKKHLFKNHISLLKLVIRKSGLYPYLNSEFDNLSLHEKLALDIFRPNKETPDFVFHSLQKLVYGLLIKRQNVVLSANTSVGKSTIIDSLIHSGLFKKIVLIVPTIALIDETRKRIRKKFDESYQIITHSSQNQKNEACIFILTQERVLERGDLENIDIFILDEFYKLNIESDEDNRAVLLNIAFTRLISRCKQFYLIGPNIDAIVGLKNLNRSYVFIPSEFSTVALNILEYNLPTHGDLRLNKTVEILNNTDEPTLIYCQSPSSAIRLSNDLLSNHWKTPSLLENDFVAWLAENYHEEWIVVKALKFGIGIHHGSLPRAIQQKIIRMFNDEEIKLLICTSTIIEGVNTSAKNVIIYDRRSNTSLVSNFTHKNIQGRAGRMGRYFIGNVHCLEEIPSNSNTTNEVNVAAGTQGIDVPLNLLYGVEKSFLSEGSLSRISNFEVRSHLDFEVFSKNPKYSPQILEDVAFELREKLLDDWKDIMWTGIPTKQQLSRLCGYIQILEKNSIARLHLSENSELATLIMQYLLSDSHSDFIKQKIDHYKYADDISSTIDWILKVLRNLFGHNIPSAIKAIADIIKFICKKNELKYNFDYGLICYKLENYHLPNNYSALDEFGIPIQVVEKISHLSIFMTEDLDDILAFIKSSAHHLPLTSLERSFIDDSL